MLSVRLGLGLLSWHRHRSSKAISERCWTLIKGRLADIKVRYSNPGGRLLGREEEAACTAVGVIVTSQIKMRVCVDRASWK